MTGLPSDRTRTRTHERNLFYHLRCPLLVLGAYPHQDVAAQMSVRNGCLSSASLFAAAIVYTECICNVFLYYLSWLSSASFPCYHSSLHCLLCCMFRCPHARKNDHTPHRCAEPACYEIQRILLECDREQNKRCVTIRVT